VLNCRDYTAMNDNCHYNDDREVGAYVKKKVTVAYFKVQ
jgi:hypothetical protein